MLKVACIGEAMIELQESPEEAGLLKRAVGGDTLNTAIYLKRLLGNGADVHYVTQLGDDPYSDEMLKNWCAEGLNTSMVHQVPNSTPGLYAIRTNAQGERSFYYWRGQAPAKALFSTSETTGYLSDLLKFDLIYFSGITLAILFDKGRNKLIQLCKDMARNSGKIAFDGNYRPRLWDSKDQALSWLTQGYQVADYALPTYEDEESLLPDITPELLLQRLQNFGANNIAIKRGADDCFVSCEGEINLVKPKKVENIVDTTAAGDSFNAGFIAARLVGNDAVHAASFGHQLAGRVITKRGAILTPADMADISLRS